MGRRARPAEDHARTDMPVSQADAHPDKEERHPEQGRRHDSQGPVRRVLLGVTGGIAAYKAAEIVRLLVKGSFDVHVVMTRNATEFITPLTLQVLSGNPVWTETFELTREHEIGHIQIVDASHLFLIAPATANVLGKVRAGIADDLLTTMVCAAANRIPVLFCPSMNVNMYRNPITQENVEGLRRRGYRFVEPDAGELACGYEGVGRLADPARIVEHVEHLLAPKDLEGEQVLVAAGRTEEAIDPVRFLTNPSSGRMGYALARAAAMRGARVTLVSGPSGCPVPLNVDRVSVRSAEEMRRAVLAAHGQATLVLMAAAVADFRPVEVASQKIKKQGASTVLQLERTPDILEELGRSKGDRFLVGFAAETEALLDNAREKLRRKNLDMIVANDVSREDVGFGTDMNEVKVIERDGSVTDLPRATKDAVAHCILDRVRALRRGAWTANRMKRRRS